MTPSTITKTLHLNSTPVKIHAISTGEVSVKSKFRETKLKGRLAPLSFIFGRSFTEWMPIWVWVIEHPEGLFVIDTGENSRINEPDYFAQCDGFTKWLNRTQFKFRVQRTEEIDQQLETIGLSCAQVDQVIMTHMHIDHFDGLHHFPDSEIRIHRLEWEKPYGDIPALYPSWLSPKLVDLKQNHPILGPMASLTTDDTLQMVHTPGHTYGHTAILLRTDEGTLCFAGDVVYYQGQLHQDKYSGGCIDFKAAAKTYERLRAFAKSESVVILPSHDGEAGERLEKLSFF